MACETAGREELLGLLFKLAGSQLCRGSEGGGGGDGEAKGEMKKENHP